ncbi:MAG: TM2 domain-containing protein [Rickettsiales bacterium]|nr:TM2 domain-containing protein [Rickettsiales bacterium]
MGISSRPYMTTLLLCIFIGWFGLHRYYTGFIGTGIIFSILGILSIFSWVFWLILFISWLIDLINIARSRFKDKKGRIISRNAHG